MVSSRERTEASIGFPNSRVPILMGSGIPLFDNPKGELQFNHIEMKVYPNGLVRGRYE